MDKGVFLKQDRDVNIAMRLMDEAIDDTYWEGLTLDEMGRRIQEILVSSNIEAYGNVQLGGRRHKNRPLKRLRQAKRLADREQRKLSVLKATRILNSLEWSEEDQERLVAAAVTCDDFGAEIKRKRIELSASDYKKRMMKGLSSNENFWKFARRVERNKGKLDALKDPVTEYNKLKDLVATELAKVSLGMKSKLFTCRGEQVIKEVLIKNGCNYERWIPTVRGEFEYEEEVCYPVSVSDVQESIKGLKLNRAAGLDMVSTTMLKTASRSMICLITKMFNEVLKTGVVPEDLQIGKMTLIDKKEPSLEVIKKRPLTVSSGVLSVLTKILHKCMNEICEREGFYGLVQYGFRKNRSTSDYVFLILAALRLAKRKKQWNSLAFCDIAKVYDSVCRELLYTKLRSIGFGGRVVAIIRAMHFNDCVKVSLKGGLSDPVYFTQGVRG